VSYLNVIKTNVNRHLYTTSTQYSLGYWVQSSLISVACYAVVAANYTVFCSGLAGNVAAHACRFVRFCWTESHRHSQSSPPPAVTRRNAMSGIFCHRCTATSQFVTSINSSQTTRHNGQLDAFYYFSTSVHVLTNFFEPKPSCPLGLLFMVYVRLRVL